MFFGLIRNSLTQNSFDYVLVVLSLYLKAIYWISFTGFPHPLHHPFSPMGGPLQIGFSLMFPPPPIESLFGTLKISVEAACYTVFNITTHCMFDTFRACMWLRSPILANLIRSQRVSFCRRNKELLYKQSKHRRRRMEREAKTKVVASVWGTKFVQFLATLAVLPRSIWKKRLNSTALSKSPSFFYVLRCRASTWATAYQRKKKCECPSLRFPGCTQRCTWQ